MSRHASVVALVLGLFALAGALAPAAPPASDPNQALAREQLTLARQALQDLDRLHKGGSLSLGDAKFALWERRQIEALRDTGIGKAELVAALEGYVKRLKEIARFAERGFMDGQMNRVDVYDSQYRILEAEMWLNREKAR